MITIIENKIQINTRLLGGSYSFKQLSTSGHTIVESGEILIDTGSNNSNFLETKILTGMIIAKPGSIVILKNLHLQEDVNSPDITSNPNNKNLAYLSHYFLKKGLLVLGGGNEEKTFSSANGQFDIYEDANETTIIPLTYGSGDHPLIIIENVKITKFGETSDVNAATFFQTNTVNNLYVDITTETYSSNIDNLEIVTSKEDGIEIDGGNINLSNITINSSINDYFIIKNGHSGTISNLNFILPSSQNSKLLTLGSTDTNDAVTTSIITGVTLDVVDATVEVNVNDIVFTRNSNYSGHLPDVTYKSNLNFELTNNDEYEIFSNVTFEGSVNCVNATFKKGLNANDDACNITLKGNNKLFTGMTLQACGGLILDTLDSTNTISDITVNNSPSFGIKLLNGSVDIGGDNIISEDINVVKDTNVTDVDQDYLIIDSHQNGTINSLHNIMSITGAVASLIQFQETNNKCTTNFVDGSYFISGTYKKNNSQAIFNNIDSFTGTLPNLYVKSGSSLTIDAELQLFSDLIAESGSIFECENVTLTKYDSSNNITISGNSTFNNNSITDLGVIRFNSQSGTMTNNFFDQCGEIQIFGGDVDFNNLSIKDPDGQVLVIDGAHTGTINDLIIDMNNSNDSTIINLASGNNTNFTITDTNYTGFFIKGEFIHSGSKNVLVDRNNDTNITIPDFLINTGDTFTLSNDLSLSSNLIVLPEGILISDGFTISKESYASGDITINSGTTSIQNTTFDSCGLLKLINLDPPANMSNLTLNTCTGMEIDGGSIDVSTLTIKDASDQFLVTKNGHSGTISNFTIDTTVDHDLSFINMASGVSTTFNNVFIKGDFKYSTSKNVLINRNNDTNITIPDLLISDTLTVSDDITLPSNLVVQTDGSLISDSFTFSKESYASGNITINNGSSSLQNITFNSCGLFKLVSLNSNATMSNLTMNTCTGMEIDGGSIDVNTLTIKDASNEFLLTKNGHSGEITDFTIDTSVEHDLSFINMDSSSTTFVTSGASENVTIQNADFEEGVTIQNGNSENFTPPGWTESGNVNLSDNCRLLLNGSGNKYVHDLGDNSMIGFRRGRKLYQEFSASTGYYSLTFDVIRRTSPGSPNPDFSVQANDVEIFRELISATTIEQRTVTWFNTENIIKLEFASNDAADTDKSAFIDNVIITTTPSPTNDVFIKGDFKFNQGKDVLINRNNDTNIQIPGLLISDTLILSNDITLPSNLEVKGNGSLIANNKIITKESYATGNITINRGLSNLQSITLNSCGLLKLVDIESNVTINDFTLNSCTGMEISGGSVNVDTLLINSSISDYLIVDYGHTGTISSVTFDLDSNYSSNKLMKLGKTSSIDTTISGPVILKTSTNVQFNESLQIFDLGTVTTTLPDINLDDSTVFNLDGVEYQIFSNLILEGTVNNSNAIISQGTGANSICNFTLKENNKVFTDVTFNSCGTLIIDNLDDTNNINNFTNNNSPDRGLQINSGSVNFDTVVIENAINEFVKIISHSGDIKDLKLIAVNTFNKSFVDIDSSVNTTFSNTDTNDNGIYIKGTLDHDGSVGIIVDADTNKTIPDLVIDNGDTLTLNNNIVLPSNLVVNGKIISDNKVFSTTGLLSEGNITINSESSLQNTTFNSCGLIKLVLLDTNSVMSALTLNSCTGMEIDGGSIDINTLTIKDASDQFLVTKNSHSGEISDFTIDTTVDHDLSFINMESGVTTTFNNVFIKGDFKYASSKNVLINRNDDTNITIPDLLISESLTISDNIKLPSNLVVQTNGSLLSDGFIFTKESYASGNVTINTGSSSLQNIIFNSCGLLKLVSLDSNATMTNLTMNTCTGMEIDGGSIDVSTLTIKDASDQFLVTKNGHSGEISDFTIDTTVDHDLSFINMESGVSTTFNNVFIKGEFKYATSKNVLINRNDDTNITIPDLLISESLTLSDNITLPSNLIVQTNGSLLCDGFTFTKESYAPGNVTINNGSSSLQNSTFNSCGLLKLVNLDSNATMSNLTLDSCTGMKVEGGSVDVSTIVIKKSSSDYLVLDDHIGTVSGMTFDLDSNFNTNSLIKLGASTSTATTLSDEIIIKSSDSNVEITKDLVIFDVTAYDSNKTFPDVLLDNSTEFVLDSNTLEYKIFSNIRFEGSVNCDGSKFTRDINANSNCNVTLKNDTKIFSNMSLESCGTLILDSLSTNSTISSFNSVSSPTVGLHIINGSVDVSTVTINSSTSDYLMLDNHTGTVSGMTFDLDSNFTTNSLIKLGGTTSTSTTLSDEIVIKSTDSNVELTEDLVIFEIIAYDSNKTFPDVLLDNSTEFVLGSNTLEYKIFSNIRFEGGVNCNGSKFIRDINANNNCNVTLKEDNKVFSNMNLESCGTLILDSLSNNNTINNFNSVSSPTIGLRIDGGTVSVDTLTIKDATGEFLVTNNSHSGEISNFTINTTVDHDLSFINMASGVSTTFNNVFIKGEFKYASSKEVLINRNDDTNIIIPDLLISETLTLSDDIKLPSNLVVQNSGSLLCNGFTFTKESYASGNVTINTGSSSVQNTIFDSCGLVKLVSLDSNATMSNLTLNTCTGMEIDGGSVDVSTLTIKDASDQFLVTKNSHSGEISNFTIDSTVDHDLSFINMASGVSTTFNNVFIKGEFKYAGETKNVLINRNNDTNIIIPDLLISETLTLSDNITLPSNLVVQTNGSLLCDGFTFTKESYASGNVTINTGSTSLQNSTFNSCGLVKLVNLDSNATMSNLTLDSCTGMQVDGGSVDVSTIVIKKSSSDYLVLDDHTGTVSGMTFDLDSNFNTNSLIKLGASTSTATTLSDEIIIKSSDSNVEITKDLVIFDVTAYDSNKTFPDVLLDNSTKFILDSNVTEYKIFSNIRFEGAVDCNGSKFIRDVNANSNCNVTLKDDNKTFTNMSLESCGSFILDSLSSNNTITNFTNITSPTVGIKISGGSVDISTSRVKDATDEFLVTNNGHSGVLSNFTIDTTVDHDLSFINMASGVSTTFNNVFIKGEFKYASTKEVLINRNDDTNITIPDLLISDSLLLSDNITLSGNLVVQTSGLLLCDGFTFSKESYATGNITINTSSSSIQNTIFDSCGLVKLVSLDSNAIMSNLTLNTCTGMEIDGGSIDISNLTIKDASGQFLVTKNSHSGEISNFTIDTTVDHDFSFINMASGVSTTFNNVFIKGDFKIASQRKEVLINRNSDTNIIIPDLLISESLTLSDNFTLSGDLIVQSGAFLVSDGKIISKDTGATGNITINTGSTSLQNSTFNNCGLVKLVDLDSNATMSNLTLDSCTGMKVEGGSIDVSTVTIKKSSSDYLVLDDHTGTVSGMTFDLDSNFTTNSLIKLGATTSTSTTLSDEITIKTSSNPSRGNINLLQNIITAPDQSVFSNETWPRSEGWGSALGMSLDGSKIAVGNSYYVPNGLTSSVHIYERNSITEEYTLIQTIYAKNNIPTYIDEQGNTVETDSNETYNYNFGRYIDMSDDGNRIVISASFSNRGTYFEVYENNTGVYEQMGDFIQSHNYPAQAGTYFGMSTTISGDGNRILTYENKNEHFFTYTWDGVNWVLEHEIDADNKNPPAEYPSGYWLETMNLNQDGSTFAAFGRVWKYDGSAWNYTNLNNPTFGRNNLSYSSISDDGLTVCFSVNGILELYTYDGSNWNLDFSITESSEDYTRHIDLNGDGKTLLMGGYNGWYVYDKIGDEWTQTVNNTKPSEISDWGKKLKMSGDGSSYIIATYQDRMVIEDLSGAEKGYLYQYIHQSGSNSVELNNNLVIFDVTAYDSSKIYPNVLLDETTDFVLDSNVTDYKIFSNIKFEGLMNCNGSKFIRDVNANSICDVTLKDDYKTFTNMSLESCGSFILDSLSSNNTISNFTNITSPTIGIEINGGSVDVSTFTINNATGKYAIVNSHSGQITDANFILPESLTDAFINIQSGTTVFTGTKIRATDTNIEFDKNLNIFDIYETYTTDAISDVTFIEPSTFKLLPGENYEVLSNTTFEGIVNCDNASFSRGTRANSICDITLNNNNKIFTNMTLDNCGSLILNSLDTSNNISSFTNNDSPNGGIKFDGGTIDVNDIIIKNSVSDYFTSDNSHSGSVSSVVFDVNENNSILLCNIGPNSTTSTTFSDDITVKTTSGATSGSNMSLFSLNNYDSNRTVPNVIFDNSTNLTLTSGETLDIFSDTRFDGIVNCSNSTFSKGTNGNNICNVIVKDDNKTLNEVTINTCGLVINNLSTNNTLSNLSINNSTDIGLHILSGSVDIDTITIKDSTNEFIKITSHSGDLKDLKLDTTNTFNKTFVDIADSVTTTFSNTDGGIVTIQNGDFEEGATITDTHIGYFTPSGWTESGNATNDNRILVHGSNPYIGDIGDNYMIGFRKARKLYQEFSANTGYYTLTYDVIRRTSPGSPEPDFSVLANDVEIFREFVSNTTIEQRTVTWYNTESTIKLEFASNDGADTDKSAFIDNVVITTTPSTINSNGIYIKGSLDHDGSVNMIIDADSNKTIPDLLVNNQDTLSLVSDFKLSSNLIVYGSLISDSKTFTKTSENTEGNITFNTGSSTLENTVFDSCGLLKLVSLSSGATMSNLTLNTCTGMEIDGGSVNVNTLNINSAISKYMVVNSHSGQISDATFVLPDQAGTNDALINIESGTTVFTGTKIIATDTNVEFDKNLKIYDIHDSYTSSDIGDIVFDEPSSFKLVSGDTYELFSNTTFKGIVNCDNASFSRGTGAKSICNITFENNNKIFTNITLNNCGSLILNSLDTSNSISSFTNNDSPSNGLKLDGGNVDISSLIVKNSTDDYLISDNSHTGSISSITFDVDNNSSILLCNLGPNSQTNTTLNGTITVKSTSSATSGTNVSLFTLNNYDTNQTIPDIIFDNTTNFVLTSAETYNIFSNTRFDGIVNCASATFSRGTGANNICNITLKDDNKTFTGMTLNACGHLKLDSLSNSNTISNLTNNNSPSSGLHITSGSVDVTTSTIKDAIGEFLVTDSSHSGIISNLTLDINNSHDESFINLGSGVQTTFDNVFIKGTFQHSGTKAKLINRNDDVNIVRPELKVSDTLTISSNMTLSSLLIVLAGGTISAENQTFTQDDDAEGGILILAGDGSTDSYEFDQYSSLGSINYGSGGSNTIKHCTLSSLGTLNKYSALTLVGCTKTNNSFENIIVNDSKDNGISIYDGDVGLNTTTIKDPVYNYINTNWGHNGLIHGLSFIATKNHTYSLIDFGNSVSKQDGSITASAFINVTYTNTEADTNKNVSLQNTGTVNHGDSNTVIFKVNDGAIVYINGIKHTSSTNAFRESFDNKVSILQRGTFTITFKQNA